MSRARIVRPHILALLVAAGCVTQAPGEARNSLPPPVPAEANRVSNDEGEALRREAEESKANEQEKRKAAEEAMKKAIASAQSAAEAPAPAKPAADARYRRSVSGLLGGSSGVGVGVGGGGVAMGVGSAGSVAYGSGRGMAAAAKSGSISYGSMAVATPAPPPPDPESIERYSDAGVNPFTTTKEDRLSTFAIDVDTGSYTLARRKINDGTLPAEDGVRVEEFLNFFRYQYAPPASGALSVHMDAAPSPFTPGRHLLRVGVQGKTLSLSERKPAHLTFLVDVSGSMQSADKLPLAQKALRILVDNLRDGDTVGLVTYAGGVREVMKPTGLEKKAQIHQAIADLTAGGSTSMSGGIELAYEQASRMLGNGRNVRVVILSDGDANVGATDHASILKLVAGKVKEGITCSVVGFGTGNYRDDLMEGFANKGNGNYAYVDSAIEARRIFQQQLGGTLEVIAKDVKLQVDFDPAQVTRYRLVGYENRAIADRDFRNDKVDAGEVGSGHSVTALYEVELAEGAGNGLATVRIRAKQPNGETAAEQAFPFVASLLSPSFETASRDLRFATAVMGAAEILRGSTHAKGWTLEQVRRLAEGAIDGAPAALAAERREFVSLVEKASKVVGGLAAR